MDSINSSNSSNPINPMNSSNSNNPSNPTNSSNSSNPSNPTTPSNSSNSMNPSNPSNSIRTRLLKSAIIVACLVLLYFSVLQGLVSDWLHLPDFSHGFLIPIVSFYFVYERRKELSVLNRSSDWIGLVLLLFGIVLLLLGNLATEYFTMRFSICGGPRGYHPFPSWEGILQDSSFPSGLPGFYDSYSFRPYGSDYLPDANFRF